MGVLIAVEVMIIYREAIDGIAQFFSGSPAIYMHVLMAITVLAPISCFVLAYLLNHNSRSIVIFLLAAHTVIVLPLGIFVAIYLLWWYVSGKKRVT